MTIKLSSVLKYLIIILAVLAVSLFTAYLARVEKRFNDLEYRVGVLGRKELVVVKPEVLNIAIATPVPTPKITPKLKVK